MAQAREAPRVGLVILWLFGFFVGGSFGALGMAILAGRSMWRLEMERDAAIRIIAQLGLEVEAVSDQIRVH